MTNNNRSPITEAQFDSVAMKTQPGQLKQRNREYGVEFSIWINHALVMGSDVDKEGVRKYWCYLS